jgi:hypothetical protein
VSGYSTGTVVYITFETRNLEVKKANVSSLSNNSLSLLSLSYIFSYIC